jgi:hypothetical protein
MRLLGRQDEYPGSGSLKEIRELSTAELRHAVEAERALAGELEQHAGQWVAVADHHVIASAETLHELLEQVDEGAIDGVLQVPTELGTACFF